MNATNAAAATSKFQIDLSAALLEVSPALAALHTIRFRRLHPSESLDTTHCSKCGAFLMDGNGGVRIIRQKARKGITRSLHRKCLSCNNSDDLPFDRGNAASFPRRKRGKHASPTFVKRLLQPPLPHPSAQSHSPIPHLLPAPQERSHARASVASATASVISKDSKLRTKKKSGLQQMLARNREREELERKAKQHETASGGLAAFLSGL